MTALLLIVLIPEWLEVHWIFYPLPRVVAEILQNLFWAFTTSTIFMLFENSVNGGGSLLERYRDIEASAIPLRNTKFSTEFLNPPSNPNEAVEFESDLRMVSMKGAGGLERLVSKWGHTIDFDSYQSTLRNYRDYLEGWRQQMARNQLVFIPDGLEAGFEESFQQRCTTFIETLDSFKKAAQNGPYWLLEEDLGRCAIWGLDGDIDADTVLEMLAENLEQFSDAEVPLLVVNPLDQRNTFFNVFPNFSVTEWGFFYVPSGDDAQWATPEGSRQLDRSIHQEAAVLERDFWLAEPKYTLDPQVLCTMLLEAVHLSRLVDVYNGALFSGLRLARECALGVKPSQE